MVPAARADPGQTAGLAFLKRQLTGDQRPDAILFNGGVFQPAVLQQRLLEVMAAWYGPTARAYVPVEQR